MFSGHYSQHRIFGRINSARRYPPEHLHLQDQTPGYDSHCQVQKRNRFVFEKHSSILLTFTKFNITMFYFLKERCSSFI